VPNSKICDSACGKARGEKEGTSGLVRDAISDGTTGKVKGKTKEVSGFDTDVGSFGGTMGRLKFSCAQRTVGIIISKRKSLNFPISLGTFKRFFIF